jgi:hypothetical protein
MADIGNQGLARSDGLSRTQNINGVEPLNRAGTAVDRFNDLTDLTVLRGNAQIQANPDRSRWIKVKNNADLDFGWRNPGELASQARH